MLQALFDYFFNLFQIYDNANDLYLNDLNWTIGNVTIDAQQWLSITCSLIMFVVIFVCCLLFIWKIVKVVARLFTGA